MADDIKKGKLKQIKGKAGEASGKVTGSKTEEIKGKVVNTAGKVQEQYGKAKKDIKKAIGIRQTQIQEKQNGNNETTESIDSEYA